MSTRARLACTLSVFLAGACGDEATGPRVCQEDFDCEVGFVCQGATADATGTCSEAAPGTGRNFGQVQLDFTGGSETYLLSVYALPTGAGDANEPDAFFSVTGLDAASSALTFGNAKAGKGSHLSPRYAFEVARRARIDAIVAALNTGEMHFGKAVTKATCTADASTMCWQGSPVSQITAKITTSGPNVTADLVQVADVAGTQINVLVDTNAPAGSDTEAKAAVAEFAKVFANELSTLGLSGHSGAVDRDGDGRFTVIFTNAGPSGTLGFFDVNDFLTVDQGGTGNEADILWVRIPGTTVGSTDVTQGIAVGTLVHEYTHLASFAQRVYAKNQEALRETLWLDEGLAHLMEDLMGWGGSTVPNMEKALSSWSTSPFASPNDSDEQRGKAYMLLRYLVDQKAKQGGASAANSQGAADAAKSVVAGLINEEALGFEHALFQADSATLVGNWLLATYATNNSDVSETDAHAYDYLDTGASGITGALMGFDPFGTYPEAAGAFYGPETTPVDDPANSSDLVDQTVPVSGSILYVVTGTGGPVTLRGRSEDAGVDFRLAVQRVQ